MDVNDWPDQAQGVETGRIYKLDRELTSSGFLATFYRTTHNGYDYCHLFCEANFREEKMIVKNRATKQEEEKILLPVLLPYGEPPKPWMTRINDHLKPKVKNVPAV